MSDSKLWKQAYDAYKPVIRQQTKSSSSKHTVPAPKRSKPRNGPIRDVFDKEAWLTTHKEYLRWRKTPAFAKWQRKQFLKQGGTCYYCDQPIYGGVRQNVDHIIPKIRRGDNRKSNLVLTCYKCNKDKYSKMLPYKERQTLRKKNRAKKGTYLKTRAFYPAESDIVDKLRQIS